MTLAATGTALLTGGKSGKVSVFKLQNQKRITQLEATGRGALPLDRY